MRNNLIIFTFFLFIQNLSLLAQSSALDWSDFRTQIIQFHPTAQRAMLFTQNADAALLMAKGGFDVKTYANYESKYFNQKNYFSQLDAGLKLPTWIGLEVKTGYQYADGVFLNPESRLPSSGQAYLGLNWSLGQGLMTDERRTTLFVARAGIEMGEAERNILMNELLYEAAKTYWNWAFCDNQVRIMTDALKQALLRHNALKESFLQGEKPAMDTLETFIQIQNRQIDLNFARIELQNANLQLSALLWTENNRPSPLPLPAAPPFPPTAPLQSLAAVDEIVSQAQQQHPELVLYHVKARQLLSMQRLKKEKKKPVLDVSYSLLGSGWQFFPTPTERGPGVFANDIKWGVNFSMPVSNRKARGDWQMGQIKLDQNELVIRQKTIDIENKVRQYSNDLNNLNAQVDLYRSVTDNYKKLLDAENEKFMQGESSVFLVNTREQRWIDAQLKLAKLTAEYQKSAAGLLWSSGKW
jgi:outer membrane protein TolC